MSLSSSFTVIAKIKQTQVSNSCGSRTWIYLSGLNSVFLKWLDLLIAYDQVKTVYDDPILIAYENEFKEEFKILDEDADVNPFNTKQLLWLDDYLENIENKIDEHKTEKNSTQIDEIKIAVVELREEMASKSKNWVIRKFAKIYAKITKQGPKLVKAFFLESGKELLKQTIKVAIESVVS